MLSVYITVRCCDVDARLVVLEDRDRSLELHLELNECLENGHSFGSNADWDHPDFDDSLRNSGQKHDSKRIRV